MRRVQALLATVYAAALFLVNPVHAATRAGLPDFTELVQANGPAVVNISTKQTESVSGRIHGFTIPDLPENSPLYDFFRRFFGEEEGGGGGAPPGQIEARSLGSGFIISPDGYIISNYHVVQGADEIVVRTSDRRDFLAKVIGSDKRSDIALLKINAKNLPVVQIGSAKDLKVGEWVLAIGSPFGFDHSATAGIVSAKGRSLPSENYVPFIQTDVAINPGNSGGPLFNMDGKVVGVNSQIYSRTGGFMGLSFAIPIDVAMDVVDQLKTKGKVSRGWLGVLIQDVTRELAETFGMGQPRGALVAQVLPRSPAEKAGLKPGDVILSYNGKPITSSSALPPMVGMSPVGKGAELEVLRRGKTVKLPIVIGELPDEEEAAAPGGGGATKPAANRIGLVVRNLSADQRDQLGIKSGGVLVENVQNGPAEEAGIRSGDVILMIDNQNVQNAAQFKKILDKVEPGRSIAALIQRGDGRMFFAIRVPKQKH
jgi:serine protease Do